MSRRTYLLENNTVLKVPIKGREQTGIAQNKNEFECYNLAKSLGLSCFPEVLSVNDNGTELVSKYAKTIKDDYELSSYLEYILNEHQLTINWNKLQFTIPNQLNFSMLAYFCFGIDQLLKQYFAINKTEKSNVNDFIMFCRICIENEQNNYDYVLLTDFFGIPIIREHIAVLALNILEYNHDRYNVFGDLIKFCLAYPKQFVYADCWNYSQYGIIDDNYVIIDSGFSKELQTSKHYYSYKRIDINECHLTYPKQNTYTFNGQPLSEIYDPNQKKIISKFFTSHNSEYILSASGMSRRIKKANLSDDGLYSWTDKLIFTSYDNLQDVVYLIQQNMKKHKPTQIKFDNNVMLVKSINSNGEWETIKQLNDFSLIPEIGKYVLEFKFDGNDGIISKYHPGHSVSYIEAIYE